MHVVEPEVHVLGDMGMLDGTRDFLDSIGATEWHPPTKVNSDNELLIEVAGRTCYKSFSKELNANLTRVRDDHVEYLGNILKSRHGSVLEHSVTSVGLVNVSRIFTHELVRHRAGNAFSQESMRFVRLDDIGMYIPSCIQEHELALREFEEAVYNAERSYNRLVELMITNDMPFAKKKEITSAIRRIAPSGHATTIVLTANHRAWRHMIEMRTATGVEEEIGVVFEKVAYDFVTRYPALYQDAKFIYVPNQKWRTVSFEHSKV